MSVNKTSDSKEN